MEKLRKNKDFMKISEFGKAFQEVVSHLGDTFLVV
jgi:hypothetical protein